MKTSLLGSEEVKTFDYTGIFRYGIVLTLLICGTLLIHDGFAQHNAVVSTGEKSVGKNFIVRLYYYC